MTPRRGCVRRSSRASLMPSSASDGGMRMSVTTTSRSCVSMTSRSSSASRQTATSSTSSASSSRWVRASRTRKLSSASAARTAMYRACSRQAVPARGCACGRASYPLPLVDCAPVRSERQRYGALLLTILAAFVLQGIGVSGRWSHVVVTALLSVAVIIALWAAEVQPRWLRVAAVVTVGVTVLSAVNPDGAATSLANGLVVSIGPPAITIGVLRGLRRHGVVTIQAVFGVLCIYLLLGMLFAFTYGAMNKLGGDPFFADGGEATGPHFLYFSFTSLTTVGYGDLTARSNLGHTLANLEALLGQIYLVTVVSVIVGNLRRKPAASPDRDDAPPLART